MTGAVMQLVTYGVQDLYLTGNPMITYFKAVFRRHTNFATEVIQQPFAANPNFGTRVSAVLARHGDLLSNLFLTVTLPDLQTKDNQQLSKWVDNVGHFLVRHVELSIGGHLIDRHTGDWLEIWAQLTLPAAKQSGYYEMIGNDPTDAIGRPTGLQKDRYGASIPQRTLHVPLQFWFCRHYGLALPVVALQYHEVKLTVDVAPIDAVTRTEGVALSVTDLPSMRLWAEYVFLDKEERNRFKQQAHEYLIEQVQCSEHAVLASDDRTAPRSTTINLSLSHPVKELIWVVQPDEYLVGDDVQQNNYTAVQARSPIKQTVQYRIDDLGENGLNAVSTSVQLRDLTNQSTVRPSGAQGPVLSAELRINGHRRVHQTGRYYSLYQPYRYHTAAPESPGIYVYSFALFPEQLQPSGTMNMSQTESIQLTLETAVLKATTPNVSRQYPGLGTVNPVESSACTCKVFAVNYNVLKIMSGMAGVTYVS